jgi:hypothetical protein
MCSPVLRSDTEYVVLIFSQMSWVPYSRIFASVARFTALSASPPTSHYHYGFSDYRALAHI